MAMSALDIGRVADALVQVMRSDVPLEQAREIMAAVSAEDRPAVTEAFVARGWQDDGEPVPARGARLQDWLTGAQDRL